MEKINIAELLKDCPKGMELDCTIFENLEFDHIDKNNGVYPIICRVGYSNIHTFTEYGCYQTVNYSKCAIFPKGKTTWEGFVPPCQFDDGDILTYNSNSGTTIFIHRNKEGERTYKTSFYVGLDSRGQLSVYDKNGLISLNGDCDTRLATEEEKQKLFDVIKANGYKWNAETKTLEKLQEFKAGDVVVSSMGNIVLISHIDDKHVIYYYCILSFPEYFRINETPNCGVGKVGNCTLASDSQKKRLFDRLKSAGYKYNPQTNRLEKLIVPKFNVGDLIQNKDTYKVTITEVNLEDNIYGYESLIAKGIGGINFNEQGEWELVPNKFDISTLKPFDKILVRHNKNNKWCGSFFSHIDEDLHSHCCKFVTTSGKSYPYCILYEGNQELLGTTNNPKEY